MPAMSNVKSDSKFTGWHMLGIMLSFFGVIITVNFVMAYFAVSSWTGLVVQNTYVASQEFNGKAAEARAWEATGIKTELEASATGARYVVTHPESGAVAGEEVVASFKHPVGEKFDFSVTLVPEGNGVFVTDHPVPAGQWIVDLLTTDNGETVYHEAIRIQVNGN